MFFRFDDLEPMQNYAGFKKCFVARVSTRSMAPLGSAYPLEDHGEADVIVVCKRWRKPNEEWIEENGGSLRQLREWLAYGYQDYGDQIRPSSFFDRMPQTKSDFASCPGFDSWTHERLIAHIKKNSIAPFMMPRRFVFNQAKHSWSFDFEYRLDKQLPGYLFSIDSDDEQGFKFVSPRKPGPGVLAPDAPCLQSPDSGKAITNLWWVKPGKLAGMPVPDPNELPAIAAAGVRSVVSLGVQLDEQALASAGLRHLALPNTDEWEPEVEELQVLTQFCKASDGAVGVCSNDQQAMGNMLGVALISEGVAVEDALETLESASPSSVESMGQIEFLYMAADQLGFDIG